MKACMHLPSTAHTKYTAAPQTNKCTNAHACMKATHIHSHPPACVRHTEAAVNGVMVFGLPWDCKWMLLCIELIELRNFCYGSLFMAITAGGVWFINASLNAAAPIPVHASSLVWATGFYIRGLQNIMFAVVCFVICHTHLSCPPSSLCTSWSGRAEWPFALDMHHLNKAELWRVAILLLKPDKTLILPKDDWTNTPDFGLSL